MTDVDIDATQFSVSGLYDQQPVLLRLMTLVDHGRDELYITGVDSTSLRVVNLGALELMLAPGEAVNQLADTTGLSTARLAYALGASRRSLFNWRQGRPVRADAEEHIRKASSVVAWVRQDLAPDSLKGWLEEGDPPAIDLMHQGLWDELEERVAQQSQPIAAKPLRRAAVVAGVPEAYTRDTHAHVLHAFAAMREAAPTRAGWRPREHTGLGDEENDDE